MQAGDRGNGILEKKVQIFICRKQQFKQETNIHFIKKRTEKFYNSLNCSKQCKWVPREAGLPIKAWFPHGLLSTKQCKENADWGGFNFNFVLVESY